MNQTVYIKCNKSICVDKTDVSIGDIAGVYCEDKHIEAKIRSLGIIKIPAQESRRYVVSILKVIEVITRDMPGITVENEGEADVIIEYSIRKGKNKAVEYLKATLVCIITLIGGAFGIMAYNNDVGSVDLFARIYTLVLGEGQDGHKIMEICYSIGLAGGIIIFYGHFGNWKFGKDPTPLEVEMRLYEDDIDTAVIKQSDREAVKIDVN